MKRRRCDEKLIARRIMDVILLLYELRLMNSAFDCLWRRIYIPCGSVVVSRLLYRIYSSGGKNF